VTIALSNRLVPHCLRCAVMVVALSGCAGQAESTTLSASAPRQPSHDALAAVDAAVRATLGSTATYAALMTGAPALGGSATADGNFDFLRADGTMALTIGNEPPETVLFLPSMVYIRAPGTPPPGGRSWLLANFGSGATTLSAPTTALQVESVNPGFILSELQWGASIASPAGMTTVRGTRGYRYAVRVDVRRAELGESGPAFTAYRYSLASEFAALADPRSTVAFPAINMVVVVTASKQLLQITVQPPGASVGVVTLTFTARGGAVAVTPPPASQTRLVAPTVPNGEGESSGVSDGG
jgi:hypothetical protein